MPQKLIPPQPIPEDEDKELAAIEILEKSISQIAALAEQGKHNLYSILELSERFANDMYQFKQK